MSFTRPGKISKKQLHSYLIIFWWVIAFFGFLSSLFYMRQFHDEITLKSMFEMSFFHWIPAVFWTIITPAIFKIYRKFPLKDQQITKSLVAHFIISIVMGLGIKILSLSLDFALKSIIGLIDLPVYEVLKSVFWIIPASTFKEILLYWIAIMAIRYASVENSLDKNILTVSGEHGLVPLPVESIYWMESNKNYIDIHSEKEKYRLRNSMGTIESELNPETFFRIHRSYIVNKEMIKTLKHWRRGEYLITLKNQKVLTSSRGFNENVKRILQA